MAVVGTVHLLAFGFDSQDSLPPSVLARLHCLHGHGIIRLIDVLVVSRDARGILRLANDGADLDVSSASPRSILWQVLDGPGSETAPPEPLELHSSAEVGLDLAAVEGLAYRIETGTDALLILVETRWATSLLDEVTDAGGFPIVFGCLEPETMLVVGEPLAAAANALSARDDGAVARGAATLDALASSPDASSTAAAKVLRALVVACIVDPVDVEESISVLADAGIVGASPIPRRHT